MLEAVHHGPRFTISLKRSTQNLQLSTSRRPITPSSGYARPVGPSSKSRHVGGASQSRHAVEPLGLTLTRTRLKKAVLMDLANAGFEFDARLVLHMVHTVPVH
jgi:hypothetical protein